MAATVVPDRGKNVGSWAKDDRSMASSPSSPSLGNDAEAAACDDVVVVLLFVCVSGAGGCCDDGCAGGGCGA